MPENDVFHHLEAMSSLKASNVDDFPFILLSTASRVPVVNPVLTILNEILLMLQERLMRIALEEKEAAGKVLLAQIKRPALQAACQKELQRKKEEEEAAQRDSGAGKEAKRRAEGSGGQPAEGAEPKKAKAKGQKGPPAKWNPIEAAEILEAAERSEVEKKESSDEVEALQQKVQELELSPGWEQVPDKVQQGRLVRMGIEDRKEVAGLEKQRDGVEDACARTEHLRTGHLGVHESWQKFGMSHT